ncbi:hypothetical protein [Arthrobacter sp. CJ23]|uniref:hypothetical protein n=1 Tax=Arthrobacter sp. CJ23 TaxID=2972479 RepID=UPI00215D1817|nr:hypothetical protein [Arthrobacter sp. CJ23]UVJ40891.1 hypothetical protein NVV90_06925 [Arthrobacter sp. CJ23]
MKNARRIVLALSLAATLSVAACSAPASNNEAGKTEVSSSSQAPDQAQPAFKKYSDAELGALLTDVLDADGQPLAVMPAEQLKAGLEGAKGMMSSIAVTPEECGGANLTGGLQAIDGASMAAAVSTPGAGTAPVQTVSLVSGLEESAIAGIIAKSKDQAEKCKYITVEVMGQKAEGEIEVLPVESKTPGAIALKTTTTFGGTATTMLQVSAARGGVVISSLYVSKGDVLAETKKATATLDEIAALIK